MKLAKVGLSHQRVDPLPGGKIHVAKYSCSDWHRRGFCGAEAGVSFKKAHLTFMISDSHRAMASWEIYRTRLPGQIHSGVTACPFACLPALLLCVRAGMESSTQLAMPAAGRNNSGKVPCFPFEGWTWKLPVFTKAGRFWEGPVWRFVSLSSEYGSTCFSGTVELQRGDCHCEKVSLALILWRWGWLDMAGLVPWPKLFLASHVATPGSFNIEINSDSCQSSSLNWKSLFPAKLRMQGLGVRVTGRSEFLNLRSSRQHLPVQLCRENLAQGVMWKARRCCCAITEGNLRAEAFRVDTS